MKLLFLLLLYPLISWSQVATEWDYNPDTVRTLYFDSHGPRPFPPSEQFPYQGVIVRTTPVAGGYEDRLVAIAPQQLWLSVRHELAAGKAMLTMFFPNGQPRLQAEFLEDTTTVAPTEYLVPSLRRPLAAHALLDGEVSTFYAAGQLRQRARYERGRRVASQCFDFKNRPVPCNSNPLLIPAGLPSLVYTTEPAKLFPSRGIGQRKPDPVTAVFVTSPQGEMHWLRVLLKPSQVDAETAGLAQQHPQFLIDFLLPATATNTSGTHSNSGALNIYLRGLALRAGSFFSQPYSMRPALLDGEPVPTFFKLPVQFELK